MPARRIIFYHIYLLNSRLFFAFGKKNLFNKATMTRYSQYQSKDA
jgi:hypothetical protein